jgi:hypothetical protein
LKKIYLIEYADKTTVRKINSPLPTSTRIYTTNPRIIYTIVNIFLKNICVGKDRNEGGKISVLTKFVNMNFDKVKKLFVKVIRGIDL